MAAFKSTAQFVIIRNGEQEGGIACFKKVARSPKELPKSSPVPNGLIPVADSEDVETSKPTISELGAHEVAFVAELATVSHEDLDHHMPDAPPLSEVDDDDVIMLDVPELDVPELDSTAEVLIIVEDTVMQDAPPLSAVQE